MEDAVTDSIFWHLIPNKINFFFLQDNKKTNGGSCSGSDECDTSKGLTCRSGSCS